MASQNPDRFHVVWIGKQPEPTAESRTGEVRYVDLFDFNRGCCEAVQMLDIHAPSSGNVENLFSDLSIPACIDHMERYFISVSTSVPPGLVAEYHDVVETFPLVGRRDACTDPKAANVTAATGATQAPILPTKPV